MKSITEFKKSAPVFESKVKDKEEVISEQQEVVEMTEAIGIDKDPPFVLVLKRKAIRLYPNQMKVAIYYNDKLGRYFSVPYGEGTGPIQAEEAEVMDANIETLHSIVENQVEQTVKFANGQTRIVDYDTAMVVSYVHESVNDTNKKRLAEMIYKSPADFDKVASFAFSKVK